MHIEINPRSGRPVYQQIIDQVKRDIALGRLRIGEKLPTVRELARQLLINPNTIAKAYRQLEQDSIIITRPGAGAYIAELTSQLSMTVRKKLLGDQLERGVVDAVHMRIDKPTLAGWFQKTVERFKMA